jgi:hypothetical protein
MEQEGLIDIAIEKAGHTARKTAIRTWNPGPTATNTFHMEISFASRKRK